MNEEIVEIWEALYNPMTEESAGATLSLHFTKNGAKKAIEKHKARELKEWRKYYPTKKDEPYRFGMFQSWSIAKAKIEQ